MTDAMQESGRTKATLAVALGATLFGFLGIFTRFLHNDKGIPSFDVAEIRIIFAVMVFLIILMATDRASFKIRSKDIPLFLVFGIFKFLSDGTYFYAQGEINLSLAALLEMTAPYYVMIISLFLFREKITAQKLMALMLTMVGCIMVTGVLCGNMEASTGGVISALLSGLFYGMFTIGGRLGHDRGYNPKTILFYTLLFALVSATVYTSATTDLPGELSKLSEPDTLGASLVLGIALTMIPFYLYTYATSKASANLVSMVAVLELVVASVVGYFCFGESLSILNICGMVLVVASIVLADVKIGKKVREHRKNQ